MNTDLGAATRAALNSATTRLYSLARDTTPGMPASAILHCLVAVDYLAALGAEPVRTTVEDYEQTLRAALTELGSLPPDVFAQADVLEAARAGRQALISLQEDTDEYLDR